MPFITDPANPEPTFGQDFNYAAWTPGTKIDLVNVTWNNDYRDIVKFPLEDGTTLNQYIDSQTGTGITINKMSFVKPNEPVRINTPFNRAYKYNYLRASNPVQPIPGEDVQRDFYYFITDVRYIAPNTTELMLQLDIWQTFGSYATFGNCYIERGHIGIANANALNNWGRDYLTIPEGLDVGGEYQVVDVRNEAIMSYTSGGVGDQDYNILVCSTVDLTADAGTKADPNLKTAEGGAFFSLPSGANYYVFQDYVALQNVLSALAEAPWVTQGIIAITVVPPIIRYIPGFAFNPAGFQLAPTFLMPPRPHTMFPNWREAQTIKDHVGSRYAHLRKLWTYPYMAVEVTTFTGTPIILKPESWADKDGTLIERIAPVPPNARIAFSPFKYNAKVGSPTDKFIPQSNNPGLDGIAGGDDHGEYMDISTQITNFPTFAIVNNGAISYLAANAHSIAYQYQSADWAQQRALQANQVSYDQSSGAMQLANDITNIGIQAATQSTSISNNQQTQKAVLGAVGDVLGGVGGGAAAGGPAGAAAGAAGGVAAAATRAISTGIDIAASQQQLAVSNSAARQSTGAQVGQQGMVRDTNKQLADWAARGDYANAVAATSAKVQDARLIQPTVSGQVGGEALNLLNQLVRISMRIKMIDAASIAAVGEFWLRYGYSVRRFGRMPESLQVMSKFTYWKLQETYISASMMPEGFKQVIRGIFEKGVTVWARPEYIGNTDTADNTPLEGIAL